MTDTIQIEITREQLLRAIKRLPEPDLQWLIEQVGERHQPRPTQLLELDGLGADYWTGHDAQEYVNALRDEWDTNAH